MPSNLLGTSPIIVVEDNPDDVFLVNRVCRRLGIDKRLKIASDGIAGIDVIRATWKDNISLIILDIKMPGLSGLQVLKQLRDLHPGSSPPIVMFTSSDEERDLREAFALGANAYVVKPLDFSDYQDTLERVIRFWVSDNRQLPYTEPVSDPR